jgi:hypothetical protein
VQAGKTSAWAGMAHGGLAGWRGWTLGAGPASLEVTIDPAAHGDVVGPLSRGVYLRTSAGKELEFTLNAVVSH